MSEGNLSGTATRVGKLRLFLLNNTIENKHMVVSAPKDVTAKLIAFARTNKDSWNLDQTIATELKLGEVMEVIVGPF
jgi:hypothetical protein